MSNENHFRAYDEASKYILRELALVNNRLTWILTIHGFLYATYGFTLQKQLEIVEKLAEASSNHVTYTDFKHFSVSVCSSLQQTKYFSEAIAAVGMFISIAGLFSIVAACDAMISVSKTFDKNSRFFSYIEQHPMHYRDTKYGMRLPHLLGGGSYVTNGIGNASSQVIPFILFLSWSAAIVFISLYGSPSIQEICLP